MKRIAFVISALSVLLIGCSKEQNTVDTEESNPQVEEGTVFSFDAVIEQAVDPDDTRATIDASTGNFSWSSTDAIAVQLLDDTFKTFTYDSSKGKFLATLSDSETIKDDGVAYYPATIAINGNPDAVSFTAGIQSGNPSGFPMKATVSLSDKTLSFTHLGGFVKLTVSRIPKDATTLQFEASGVTLSGTFAVASNQISATSGTKTTLSCSVEESSSSKEFTLIVPVTTFASGFTMKFLNDSDEDLFTKSTAKSISVGRAKMTSMASIDIPVSLYINYTEPWFDNATPYAYVYDASSEYSTWPGKEITGDTFTHDSKTYKRVIDDLSFLTSPISAIINIGWTNDASGVPYGDLYRVVKTSIDITQDVYLSVTPITDQSTAKIYFRNWSTNGWITKVWARYTDGYGGTNITSGWPGTPLTSMNSESLDASTYRYITATTGTWIELKGANNDGNSSIKNNINIEVKSNKNTLVTLKDDDQTWTFDFGIATITID